MSYLARLKLDLGTIEPATPKTSVGFVGGSTGDFLPDRRPEAPIFSAERKKSLLNQFLPTDKSPPNGLQPVAFFHEKRPGHEPTKPTEGCASTVDEWRRRFYVLNSSEPPCPGFRSREWSEAFDTAHAFLEHHAEAAHALGWTALDLFAVHRAVGATRVDCCGALMVAAGHLVSAVERDVIHYVRARDGQPNGRFFRRLASPEMIPVWSFAR